MNLTPEEREIGRDNYYQVVSDHDHYTRRGFLKQVIAAGGVGAAGIGAYYFGYHKPYNPVRIGIIGTGDEGNVLIGALNPDYVQVKAIADIRPSSRYRAFHGDWSTPNTIKVRPGLMNVYDFKSLDQATKEIKMHTDYRELLKDKDIEGVIIALPLHLHAQVAMEAMMAGKHVLTEKLMAHNIAQCKLLGRVSEEQKKYCATGHQRHYSILYDNAVNMIRWGVLGQIHHIRAQWHRGNLPGADSWELPLPGGERVLGSDQVIDKLASELANMKKDYAGTTDVSVRNDLKKKIELWIQMDLDKTVDAAKYGYQDDDKILGNGQTRSALEELIRWRLWDRTGNGLMAELGSHQLDAASIFISAMSDEKVHPLTVHAVGGRHIFPPNRDADDHVYCTFEFPNVHYDPEFAGYNDKVNRVPDPVNGIPGYDSDPNKKVVVTYSSINGNGYGGYGEIVMGTKGTLVLETEKEVYLYQKSDTNTKVGAKADKGKATLDTTASGDGPAAKAVESGPVSRGYAEEIEHWAWCIRSNDWSNQPRCKPDIAVADAVIALTSRLAMKQGQKPGGHGFVQFKKEWFNIDHDAVPEVDVAGDATASIAEVKKQLGLI
jgi:predicted dehydrogenase